MYQRVLLLLLPNVYDLVHMYSEFSGGVSLILVHVEDSLFKIESWSLLGCAQIPGFCWVQKPAHAEAQSWGERIAPSRYEIKTWTLMVMGVGKKAYSVCRYRSLHIQIVLEHSHLKFSVAVTSLPYFAVPPIRDLCIWSVFIWGEVTHWFCNLWDIKINACIN